MTGREGVDEEKRTTLRRFAALGAAPPLARFSDTAAGDAGESEARDAIAGYVAATPGAHFSKVRDDLGLGTGETQHHLRRLEDANVIEGHRDGDYRRFFPANHFDAFEQVALSYLRRETPRGMLVTLLRAPDSTASDLASTLEVSRPTVSKYAGELEEAGLLTREDGYAVVNPETILVLVVRYANSFDADAVALAAMADDLITVHE